MLCYSAADFEQCYIAGDFELCYGAGDVQQFSGAGDFEHQCAFPQVVVATQHVRRWTVSESRLHAAGTMSKSNGTPNVYFRQLHSLLSWWCPILAGSGSVCLGVWSAVGAQGERFAG